MEFYNYSKSEILEKFKTTEQGLSQTEVKKRVRQFGKNIIEVQTEPLWQKLIEPFKDIFVLVLVIAAGISLFHGEILDSVIIIFVILFSATIFYIQKFSADRVLKSLSLKEMQSVDVMRGGAKISLKSIDLLPGDIILLTEGEKVPADIRLVQENNLRVDESQLTGESLSIDKTSQELTGSREIFEQSNMLFYGSFIVSGTAIGVVVNTGNRTKFGYLATLTKKTENQSPIQKKIDRLITQIISVIGGIALVLVVFSLVKGIDFLDSLRFILALTVSAVPESLPIAISVIMVLGMRRMSKKQALVHQIRAIETIGAVTVIATDKTGTLTQNKLVIQKIWTPSQTQNLDSILPYYVNNGRDPLDHAIRDFCQGRQADGELIAELPFEQAYNASANIWHKQNKNHVYLKGSAESIFKFCKTKDKNASKALDQLMQADFRVIALAYSKTNDDITDFADFKKLNFEFVGLIAMADKLRPESKKSITLAKSAGITVKMITGDHFETAFQIGEELGLIDSRDQVFDCRQMNTLTENELNDIIERCQVFSRVLPEQKHHILTILKKHHVVAMTGDGVNDVPALSNAHVGVTMGSGSDIAKDAGAIVLLDDNFKTIIDAVKEGRTIIANIHKILFYLLSTSTGEIVTIVGSFLLSAEAMITPIQILWINLVTDTIMSLPIGIEPSDLNIMQQPPRSSKAPILSKILIIRMIMTALLMSAIALFTYYFFSSTHGHRYAQTLAFVALIVIQWSNAFNARSLEESLFSRLKIMNKSFYLALGFSILLQSVALFTPFANVLGVVPVDGGHLLAVLATSIIIPILASELFKFVYHKTNHSHYK